MLYTRAKDLQAQGLTSTELMRTLLAEGFTEPDIKVILGSLGIGPQPQPDPAQQPLTLARRVLESRPLRALVFAFGAAIIAGLLWLVWMGVVFVRALFEGFGRGC